MRSLTCAIATAFAAIASIGNASANGISFDGAQLEIKASSYSGAKRAKFDPRAMAAFDLSGAGRLQFDLGGSMMRREDEMSLDVTLHHGADVGNGYIGFYGGFFDADMLEIAHGGIEGVWRTGTWTAEGHLGLVHALKDPGPARNFDGYTLGAKVTRNMNGRLDLGGEVKFARLEKPFDFGVGTARSWVSTSVFAENEVSSGYTIFGSAGVEIAHGKSEPFIGLGMRIAFDGKQDFLGHRGFGGLLAGF